MWFVWFPMGRGLCRGIDRKGRKARKGRKDDGLGRTLLLSEVVGDASDAVLEVRFPEVEKQAQTVASDAEIREDLFSVRESQALDALQLNQDQILDDEIGAEANVEAHVLIAKRDSDLPLDSQAALNELVAKDGLVDRLKEPRPKMTMDLHRGVHHDAGNAVLWDIASRIPSIRTSALSFAVIHDVQVLLQILGVLCVLCVLGDPVSP